MPTFNTRSKGSRKPPTRSQAEVKTGSFTWLTHMTFGKAFEFLHWSLGAIVIAIIIEWVGMAFWWDADHSMIVLQEEIGYLSSFNRNLLLNIYPGDLAQHFIGYFNQFLQWSQLNRLGQDLTNSTNSIAYFIGMGIQSSINVIFLFCVRLAICVSAITGFVVVGILAFMDGLTEREIRKNCGGHESALVYHHAKKWLGPSFFLALGFYLTIPFSIHPTIIFLPAMAITGFIIFTAASKFKKFL
jgi:integrating conjugative element membrane protein (TIGR03747 family)